MTSLEPGPEFEALLGYLRQTRGFDFTSYKRTTLCRRMAKRMGEVRVESFEDYMDYLEVHTDEFGRLFDTVLINVTSFFRDPEAWATVAGQVVPAVTGHKPGDQPIRVWSAGCATGEEAYTLAILFAEALGEEAFRRRVKIYATDIDEGALAAARQGVYPTRATDEVDAELRDRYFQPVNGNRVFRAELRRSIIFGRHDLTVDAPISRLDLLVCRNTLMYLNAEAQRSVLERFNFALAPEGFLFLGRAEMLLSHPGMFQAADIKARVFQKITDGAALGHPPPGPVAAGAAVANGVRQLRDFAFDAAPQSLVLVNLDGCVVSVNDQARAMFGIRTHEVGRPLQDLELSYRPVELRARIEQAYAERRAIYLRSIERLFPDGDAQYLDVVIQPLPVNSDGSPIGVLIGYVDVTRYHALQLELKHSSEDLETAYGQLQSANEALETSNEELQATVEELETTNEELQSANEELETMNEELQATNEELETMNEELRTRSRELDTTNSLLESVLATEPDAMVALDHELRVLRWNGAAVELWGLRSDEVVGRSLFELDFGLLPAEGLLAAVRACRDQRSPREELSLAAINRRGRHLQVQVTCTPLVLDAEPLGVIVRMQDSTPSQD